MKMRSLSVLNTSKLTSFIEEDILLQYEDNTSPPDLILSLKLHGLEYIDKRKEEYDEASNYDRSAMQAQFNQKVEFIKKKWSEDSKQSPVLLRKLIKTY